jgi:hypothetical protein
LNNIEITYQLVKKLIEMREDLANWARSSRENRFSEIHEKQMLKKAFEIDELLREVGTEWITDYEENIEIKKNLEKGN